jgi:4-hydroxybenzoate polyprenyltransferase
VTGFLLKTSRPRFWLYLAGPYVVGYTAGADGVRVGLDPLFALWLVYFLLPANLLLYGVNDYFDRDTDALNPKKGDRENRLRDAQARTLRRALAAVLAATVLAAAPSTDATLYALWAAFVGLSAAYSAPPLRLKARPLVDSASNVLYGLPGVIGYYQSSGTLPPAAVMLAVLLWTAGMHLFSAVPDIACDREAGVRTTAVALGYRGSLLLCAALWAAALAAGAASVVPAGLAAAGLVYPAVPLWLAARPRAPIGPVYWSFPLINGLAGFCLFGAAFLSKPHA